MRRGRCLSRLCVATLVTCFRKEQCSCSLYKRPPNMYFLLLFFVFGYCYGLGCSGSSNPYFEDSAPVVKTESGSIVGKKVEVFGDDVSAFMGIPYAEPPIGEKRFSKPKPISPWTGVLDASTKPPPCMQYSSRNYSWVPTSKPSEDCLYLNVWTPTTCCGVQPRLPVLVWIHGGGFYSGSSEMDVYDGSVLACNGNVVLVSMNYRVGVFGFMNGGTKSAIGNLGMYDQNLALQWIKKNIKNFGGDPDNITILGQSAGSMSVSLHIVSPLSRGLFHRAIMMSGTAIHPQLLDSYPSSLFKANMFAQAVRCSKENASINAVPDNVIDCLRKKDALELAQTEDLFTSKLPFLFLPTTGEDFLPRSPVQAFDSGDYSDVDVLIGNVKDEGTIFLNYIMPHIFPVDTNPVLTVDIAEEVIQGLFQTVPNPASDKIFKIYFQNATEGDSLGIAKLIADAFADYSFNCPNMFLAEKMKNTYFYWQTHRSERDPTAEWVGVTHFTDVPYVFGGPIQDHYTYTPEDGKFSDNLIQKWTTFCRTGCPLKYGDKETWPSFSASNPVAFELNSKYEKKLRFPRAEACEFWRPYFLTATG